TTLGRLMLKLTEPTDGAIAFDGTALGGLSGEGLRAFRRQAQLVFQNPFDALNPRFTIYRAVAEPLLNAGVPKAEHADRVAQAFRRVHLPDLERYLDRYPHQLSGGQLQRVVLARALVLDPRFLVADEPVSMLDVSIRAGILNMMMDLRERLGVSMLYITHDIASARYVADRILVMYAGHLVETGPAEAVLADPRHPYTQLLLAAVPDPREPTDFTTSATIGEPPKVVDPTPGCRFRWRCPYAIEECSRVTPSLRPMAPGQMAACHVATPDAAVQELAAAPAT
ncbi:MAG TPA: ABC transporter ATP-binding protein, partial [Candidatus Limnocylindrales bacterium]